MSVVRIVVVVVSGGVAKVAKKSIDQNCVRLSVSGTYHCGEVSNRGNYAIWVRNVYT